MYDLVVIGAGWAGFSAAVYASELGFKTALIERDSLGGTCLNYGCIPTKTLLNTTKLLSQFKKSAKFGINAECAAVNLTLLNQRMEEVVSHLRSGIEFLVKANKIDLLKASATILNPNQVKVDGQILEARYILIATGSKAMELPNLKFDGNKVISSAEALRITNIPKKILIIGGGVIGCEFAEIFLSLGSEVEIVELSASLLPGIDREAAKRLEAILRKRQARICLNTDAAKLNLEDYDKVLLCVGRVPYCDCFDGIALKKERAGLAVNEYLETSVPNIYAAGDCIGGYLLAHVASYEGRLAVKNITGGNKEKVNYKAVPSCVYTNPEIAAVGLNEDEARKLHQELSIKKIDFRSVGMSYVIDEQDGFVKIIADKQGNLLGASIIGPKASELIHVLTIAINQGLKINQIKETIFAHPTVSESIHEALLH